MDRAVGERRGSLMAREDGFYEYEESGEDSEDLRDVSGSIARICSVPRRAVASRKCKLTRHPAHKQVQYEAQTNHLRHAKFIALRDDKDAREVGREVLVAEA
jgi:hypothetical protein